MSLADLVTIKLNHIAKNRNARNVHLTVERLHDVLDKHEEQAAGDALKLKVVRERQLMAFLNENGLSRYAVAVLRLGVGSIEELKCVSKKDLLAKSKFGMNKADAKRLTAAFTRRRGDPFFDAPTGGRITVVGEGFPSFARTSSADPCLRSCFFFSLSRWSISP